MKYAAINLGPIIKTFSMARKPREFWAASYLFSYLMQCILNTLDKEKDKMELISPYYTNQENQTRAGIGLFPDRAFYKVVQDTDLNDLLENAVITFACKINLDIRVAQSFFRVMWVCQEYGSTSEAISGLNRELDILELNQTAWEPNDYDTLWNYLQQVNQSSQLTNIAFGRPNFPIESLDELARCGVKHSDYSFQRYVCIVQADGDHMGKIVSSENLNETNTTTPDTLNSFSEKLICFGKNACQKIRDFKGLPIYAGGDDLLFIAPVCNDLGKTIFDLLDEIDSDYGSIQACADNLNILDSNEQPVHTSLSYGISIIYHKYPLYEAWEIARDQLFSVAKNKSGRNAIALNLRKNSGSDFQVILPKGSETHKLFKQLIRYTPGESLVSAVAHKIRSNEAVLSTLPATEPYEGLSDRLEAFYEKTIDTDAKSENEQIYLQLTRNLFEQIYRIETGRKDTVETDNDRETPVSKTISTLYGMLRTAKFIKGEEVKNE